MEKYGVKLDDSLEKKAGVTKTCPKCGAKLKSSNPPICPNCGSKPFEKNPGKFPIDST